MIQVAPQLEAEATTVRVLLVEDSQADVLLMKRYLQRVSPVRYQVTVARTRETAVTALRQPFDVCIMDFYLGGFTGMELLQGFDAEELSGPVILITGVPDERIDQQALDRGVADFLSKAEAVTPLLDRSIRYACRQFEQQRRLRHLVEHDPLTGLLNRESFTQRLIRLRHADAQQPQGLYLLCVGVDGLNTVNDNWGHGVGDRALVHVSSRLGHAVGESAPIGRVGGDAMVVAVTGMDESSVESLAQRILAAMREPLSVGAEQIVTTVSIGIVSARQSPSDVQEFVRLADHAMLAAKRAGRDTFSYHRTGRPATARLRALLETDLRQAVGDDELWIGHEPQISLQDGRLTGAEALARWTHPKHGNVSPSQFIPLAQACGLIRPLTRWSLREAVASLASWAHLIDDDFRLAVNVAPAALLSPGFAEQLDELLSQGGVSARNLRLEITEDYFAYDDVYQKLQRLHDMGLSLALDDFGTGYSSLARLSRLPIDTLKIDQSFVKDMTTDARAAALVKSILSVGKDLDMTVIAEGVETAEQADRLLELGCRTVQGFLYGTNEDRLAFTSRLL